MKIILTAEEIQDRGFWEKFCKDRGLNKWAVSEGLMNSDTEFTFNEKEVKKYGL